MPEQAASARPDKDREVPHTTGKGSEPAPLTEPRCRVCRRPDIRQGVNRMLVDGYSLSAILQGLTAVNSGLPPKSRITKDSLETHRSRHFDLQAGASALWRRILEERVAAETATYEEGVVNLLTPRVFFETLLIKSYASLTNEAAEVSIDQGVAAARELGKLTAAGDDAQRWAAIHATQNRIVATFKEVVPTRYHQAILDKLEGRQPVPTSRQLAVMDGGLAGDGDEVDPLDGADEYSDED